MIELQELLKGIKLISKGGMVNLLSTAMYEEDLLLRYSLELKHNLSYISSDGSQIAKLLLYMFAKFCRFLIDYGMVYQVMSPIFEQGDKKFYPNDPLQPGTTFPVGLDPNRPFKRYKGLANKPSIEVIL